MNEAEEEQDKPNKVLINLSENDKRWNQLCIRYSNSRIGHVPKINIVGRSNAIEK